MLIHAFMQTSSVQGAAMEPIVEIRSTGVVSPV